MAKNISSSAAKNQAVPARKILRRSPYRQIGGGRIPHLSVQELYWESRIEDWAIPTLGLCHDLRSLSTQKIAIEYLDEDNKKRKSAVDIHCVTSKDKNLLVEVKAWKTVAAGHLHHDLSLIRKSAAEQGYTYILLVDLQLRQQPLFNRTDFLQRYLHSLDELHCWEQVVDYLKSVNTASLRDVELNTSLRYDQICSGVARSMIAIEPSHSYSPHSLVSLPDKPFKRVSYGEILDQSWSDAVLEELHLGGRNINKFKPVAIVPNKYWCAQNTFSCGVT